MRVLVSVVVRMVVTNMIMIVPLVMTVLMAFVLRLGGAYGWLLFSGFRSRFSGLLRLLLSDCQWVAFRRFRWRNGKPLV